MYYDENNNYFEYNNEINKDYFNVNNSKKYDMYNEINISNPTFNTVSYRNNNLFTPAEGLNKGNMFRNLYNPYKNYVYKVVVRGKREELLLSIQELTFALKDLNLYLDLHPDDRNALETFKNYSEELKRHKDMYNKEYSSLCAVDTNKNYFDWVTSPWPWDNMGGNTYV